MFHFIPVVVKDLKAIDIEDTDDRVFPGEFHTRRLWVNGFVDALDDPGKHAVIDRLETTTNKMLLGAIIIFLPYSYYSSNA